MSVPLKKHIRQRYLRLLQQRGSPESVGRGAAIGLLVAFAIPFSLQMLIAFPLAVALKAARLPALLFTWVSNPVTIPVLYPLQCYVGGFLIGHPFSYASIREQLSRLFANPSWGELGSLGAELVAAFFAGGLLFGFVSAAAGYVVVVRLVREYRERKERRHRPVAGLAGGEGRQ